MARGQWTQGSGSGLDTSEVTATTDKVLKGYTAGVRGSDEPQEGTLEVQSIVNFNVALYGSLALIGTWQNPEVGPYSGVMIRYKAGEYPETMDDGDLAYEGAETSFILENLTENITYYFRAWSYITTNFGRIYAKKNSETKFSAQIIRGNKNFTGSASWTVPDGVRTIDIFCVGGGGRGGEFAGFNKRYGGSGGGGSGYTNTLKNVAVIPGQVLAIGVAGESGQSYVSSSGIKLCYANGGAQGQRAAGTGFYDGGAGGSEGGGNWGDDGESDGKYGQNRTTRAFGEASGTLYAGGGGGGDGYKGGGGNGGAGGGGHGAYGESGFGHSGGTSGSYGTGGGGGGAGCMHESSGVGAGGSGVVLIRWGY